ncbi:MAG: hypothetical protein CMI00_12630 [Oceanospirillaceae bacterium]|nr:hypothetical protein [Oceanospirillaceae bacterium]
MFGTHNKACTFSIVQKAQPGRIAWEGSGHLCHAKEGGGAAQSAQGISADGALRLSAGEV